MFRFKATSQALFTLIATLITNGEQSSLNREIAGLSLPLAAISIFMAVLLPMIPPPIAAIPQKFIADSQEADVPIFLQYGKYDGKTYNPFFFGIFSS